MRSWNWPLIGFFLLLSALLIVGIFMPPEERICSATLLDKAAAQANTPVFGCPEFWLNRYQTGIAAILALGAAILSAYFLQKQISVSERQEADRFARQNAAARAMLQLSLNSICCYAQRSAETLLEALEDLAPGFHTWTGTPPAVERPDRAIEQMQKLIETVPVTQINAFSDLIGKIQIHEARRDALSSAEGVSRENLKHYIIDAVEIYARASKLFSYARRQSDDANSKLIVDEMLSNLRILRVEFDDEDALRERLSRRFPI